MVCGATMRLCFLCGISVNKVPYRGVAVISISTVRDVWTSCGDEVFVMFFAVLQYSNPSNVSPQKVGSGHS